MGDAVPTAKGNTVVIACIKEEGSPLEALSFWTFWRGEDKQPGVRAFVRDEYDARIDPAFWEHIKAFPDEPYVRHEPFPYFDDAAEAFFYMMDHRGPSGLVQLDVEAGIKFGFFTRDEVCMYIPAGVSH